MACCCLAPTGRDPRGSSATTSWRSSARRWRRCRRSTSRWPATSVAPLRGRRQPAAPGPAPPRCLPPLRRGRRRRRLRTGGAGRPTAVRGPGARRALGAVRVAHAGAALSGGAAALASFTSMWGVRWPASRCPPGRQRKRRSSRACRRWWSTSAGAARATRCAGPRARAGVVGGGDRLRFNELVTRALVSRGLPDNPSEKQASKLARAV